VLWLCWRWDAARATGANCNRSSYRNSRPLSRLEWPRPRLAPAPRKRPRPYPSSPAKGWRDVQPRDVYKVEAGRSPGWSPVERPDLKARPVDEIPVEDRVGGFEASQGRFRNERRRAVGTPARPSVARFFSSRLDVGCRSFKAAKADRNRYGVPIWSSGAIGGAADFESEGCIGSKPTSTAAAVRWRTAVAHNDRQPGSSPGAATKYAE
jgi:hypothetical protein